MPAAELLAKGLVQRIGKTDAKLEQRAGGQQQNLTEAVPDHAVGLRRAMELLTESDNVPLASVEEIGAVGHRVVHGGEHFADSAVIDDDVVRAIEEHSALAPLHNPPNLLGIRVARELLPHAVQVAVFDTAFHQTLPPRSYLYAMPKQYYEQDRIRRYGFHGTSHKYVAMRSAVILKEPLDELNLITCHLGNGASMAAIKQGRVVDTSMGLTPLEGLVMGTRSGDIDPAIIFHLARTRQLPLNEIEKMLNKRSGLLGLSTSSNDVRELLQSRQQGDGDAAQALEVFCYRIKKYVGAYLAVLGKLDALVFTAGIGENAPPIRAAVCQGLAPLGLELDASRNDGLRGKESDISTAASRSRILVVPTNEEKLIAMDTYALTELGAG